MKNIPGRILIDPYGDMTIECPVSIRKIGKVDRIFLDPQQGLYNVVEGTMIYIQNRRAIPGPSCNIASGADIFLPSDGVDMVYGSVLQIMTPRGEVYGSPEPTENELNAVNAHIDHQQEADPKNAQMLEADRPKPLRYKHLILLYVTKCALEQFYNNYMKHPQVYVDTLVSESGVSAKFQSQSEQDLRKLVILVLRIAHQLSSDKSGGWENFRKLFAATIPEQLCKHVEMAAELTKTTTFMLPVLEIQRELGEVCWNIARVMLIKGGQRLPPIPRATPPTGRYKGMLDNIRQEIQAEHA